MQLLSLEEHPPPSAKSQPTAIEANKSTFIFIFISLLGSDTKQEGGGAGLGRGGDGDETNAPSLHC